MPFVDEFHAVYDAGIKPACEAAGADCARVDEQVYQGTVLQQIYNQIAKADLVVADLTKNNPNVCYEAGYAHALGKKTVLLTQDAKDIPFNLRLYPYVVYGKDVRVLKAQLESRVRWHLGTERDMFAATGYPIRLRLNGQELSGPKRVNRATVTASGKKPLKVRCELNVFNGGEKPLPKGTFRFALLSGAVFSTVKGVKGAKSVSIPDGKQHTLPDLSDVLPGEWAGIEFELTSTADGAASLDAFGRNLTLRVLTASGPQDYAITID